MPLYAGIETLRAKGDQVQWGGPTLYADGRFATPDGKAHFSPVGRRPAPQLDASGPGDARGRLQFRVSTRRGKQFNSMVQRDVDPLTGAAPRRRASSAREDLARLRPGGRRARCGCDRRAGRFDGRLKAAPIKPGNLEVHWPEGNALLSATAIDPDSMEPDYNAVVTIERARQRG